jgi:Family of unknown function (DUF5985)
MTSIPGLVYILSAFTSLLSAVLLLRGAFKRRGGLLFWSGLCFLAMAVSNVLLYLNFIVFPEVDLIVVARLTTAVGITLLNIGLIWHTA